LRVRDYGNQTRDHDRRQHGELAHVVSPESV
jgi:hypothetical protein